MNVLQRLVLRLIGRRDIRDLSNDIEPVDDLAHDRKLTDPPRLGPERDDELGAIGGGASPAGFRRTDPATIGIAANSAG